jgi:hypothetical protein|tara:strand:- start:19010 stop:19753 length:744 start_codon:yes stop_codon:yes gene_type:complete
MTISNVPNWKQFEIDGWQECCAELKEFVLHKKPEIALGMSLMVWRRCWPQPYLQLPEECPKLWDLLEPTFGKIRQVGFFVMHDKWTAIHTDNYDAIADGKGAAGRRINMPVMNCEQSVTRFWKQKPVEILEQNMKDEEPHDRNVNGARVAVSLASVDDDAQGQSPEWVADRLGAENLKWKPTRILMPDGTHYNNFAYKNMLEIDSVVVDKPTILRVDVPHNVTVTGWNFPRVTVTVGFEDEELLETY